MMHVPYNGSGIAASALCMDKYETNVLLKSSGIAVPQSILIKNMIGKHYKRIKIFLHEKKYFISLYSKTT